MIVLGSTQMLVFEISKTSWPIKFHFEKEGIIAVGMSYGIVNDFSWSLFSVSSHRPMKSNCTIIFLDIFYAKNLVYKHHMVYVRHHMV